MFQSLSVSLVYASGPMMKPPLLHLAIQASGVRFPAATGARVTAALRDRAFVDVDLSSVEFDALCRAAEAAGFGERLPRVEARVDTSDSLATLLLRVGHERGAFTLSLGLMSSSYDGPDAPALRRFLALLLSIGGVREGSILHDLVGPS